MTDYTEFRILLDEPAVNPELGFKEYGQALSEIIRHSPPRFAIGIFGDWGSGKTTLMRHIYSLIETDPGIVPVWFNAWRYEREQHLIVPMLDVLRESLQIWAGKTRRIKTAKDTAHQAAATMARAGRALLAGFKASGSVLGVDIDLDPGKILDSLEGNDADKKLSFYHASFNAMRDAISEFSDKGAQRIVIFVDDLDRCLPANALEVLESMKLLFDMQGFVFVLGLNKDIIERAIKLKYFTPGLDVEDIPPINGADYVKKIFQVPFGLPVINLEQLQTYFTSIVDDNDLPDDQQADLRDVVQRHLTYLSEDGAVNPREVKRFINSYTLQAKMLKPKLDSSFDANVVLALQVMNFRPAWFNLYDELAIDPALFQQTVSDVINAAGVVDVLNLRGKKVALPRDFLTYVQQPYAQKLLSANLDAYLSSAEATRSSSPGLLKAQTEVANVRALIGEVAAGYSPQDKSTDLASSLSIIKSESKTQSNNMTAQIDKHAMDIESRFANQENFGDDSERKRWVDGTMELIDAIDRSVTELRRLASFGTT